MVVSSFLSSEFCLRTWYTVLEKWIFENIRGPFYDDVIYTYDSYLWSNKELLIQS